MYYEEKVIDIGEIVRWKSKTAMIMNVKNRCNSKNQLNKVASSPFPNRYRKKKLAIFDKMPAKSAITIQCSFIILSIHILNNWITDYLWNHYSKMRLKNLFMIYHVTFQKIWLLWFVYGILYIFLLNFSREGVFLWPFEFAQGKLTQDE
jgi:hypothetical protein